MNSRLDWTGEIDEIPWRSEYSMFVAVTSSLEAALLLFGLRQSRRLSCLSS